MNTKNILNTENSVKYFIVDKLYNNASITAILRDLFEGNLYFTSNAKEIRNE